MTATVDTSYSTETIAEARDFYVDQNVLYLTGSTGRPVSAFALGQWNWVRIEPDEAEPEVVGELTLELLRKGPWADSDGDVLSVRGSNVCRSYAGGDSEHVTNDEAWIVSALTEYGPYTRVTE